MAKKTRFDFKKAEAGASKKLEVATNKAKRTYDRAAARISEAYERAMERLSKKAQKEAAKTPKKKTKKILVHSHHEMLKRENASALTVGQVRWMFGAKFSGPASEVVEFRDAVSEVNKRHGQAIKDAGYKVRWFGPLGRSCYRIVKDQWKIDPAVKAAKKEEARRHAIVGFDYPPETQSIRKRAKNKAS